MSVESASGFLASVLKEGIKVKDISNLGAFEIQY